MKNILKVLCICTAIVLFSSCKKEDDQNLISPIPPDSISITYIIKSYEIGAETLERKIVYISDWKDSLGNIVPILDTLEKTGDFSLTIKIKTIHEPVGESYPGKYNCMVPAGIGWESTDGRLSLSVVEIKNGEILAAKKSGGCQNTWRPFFKTKVYLYDMYW